MSVGAPPFKEDESTSQSSPTHFSSYREPDVQADKLTESTAVPGFLSSVPPTLPTPTPLTPPNLESGIDILPSDTDSPPDGGYGWVCVFAVFLMTVQTWGVSSSFGVFLNYYLTSDVFPGSKPLQFAFIGGMSVGVGLFFSPLATLCLQRFGMKPTICIGMFLETGGLILASFINPMKIYQLFLTQGVCFSIGSAFIFISTAGVVPQWFTKKRGLANALSTGGSGVGGVIFAFSLQAIIHKVSLAWAFRFLAISTFTFNTIGVILVRQHSSKKKAKSNPFDYRLFARFEFLLLLGTGFFFMLGYIGILFTLQSYATSLGFSSSQSAVLGALLNAGQIVGRPSIGLLSDYAGRLNIAFITYLISAILAFALWIPATTYSALVAYGIVGGLFLGTFWATVATVSAEIMGLDHLTSSLSVTWFFVSIPCIFSEVIILQLRETPQRYLSAQLFAGFMYVLSAACVLALRGWKLRDLQREKLRLCPDLPSHQSVSDVSHQEKETVGRHSDGDIAINNSPIPCKESAESVKSPTGSIRDCDDNSGGIDRNHLHTIASIALGTRRSHTNNDSDLDLRHIPTHNQDGENVADDDNNTIIPPNARVPKHPESMWRLAFYITWV